MTGINSLVKHNNLNGFNNLAEFIYQHMYKMSFMIYGNNFDTFMNRFFRHLNKNDQTRFHNYIMNIKKPNEFDVSNLYTLFDDLNKDRSLERNDIMNHNFTNRLMDINNLYYMAFDKNPEASYIITEEFVNLSYGNSRNNNDSSFNYETFYGNVVGIIYI